MPESACNNCESNRSEDFVRWFLRFNGYLGVESFIIHNPDQKYNDTVGAHTESDVLAVRMPFSKEIIDGHQLKNFSTLVDGADTSQIFDVVIAEVGVREKKPNKTWNKKQNLDFEVRLRSVKYMLQYIGLFPDTEVEYVARDLLNRYHYSSKNCRARYVIFCESPSKAFSNEIKYITFEEMLEFLVRERDCWERYEIALRSEHSKWHPLFRRLFAAINLGCEDSKEKFELRCKEAKSVFKDYIFGKCGCKNSMKTAVS